MTSLPGARREPAQQGVSGGLPRALPALLAVALAVRAWHWASVRGEPFVARLVMDSQEYDRWARTIAGGDWLGSETFFQAPLYPYVLAVVYRLFGPSVDLVYWLQILAGTAACLGLYLAGRLLGGVRHGLAAAGLGALYGPFVFYDVQLLKESLAVSVVAFLLWVLLAARRARRAAWWWLAGGLCGVATLLRENMLLVVPLLLVLAWTRDPRSGDAAPAGPRRGLVRAGMVVGGLVLVLSPVAVRNGVVGGSYLPTTFQGGANFYIGNNPEADGTYRPIVEGKQIPVYEREEPVRLAQQALGRELTPAEVSSYWLGRGLDWARREPVAFLRLQVRKLGMFWSWYEWPDAVDYYYLRTLSPPLRLLPLELGGVVILACAGLWLRRRRLFGSDLPVLLFVLGWTASTVIFFLFARYRLPVVPALLLWAAEPLARLWHGVAERRWRAAAGWGALVVVALALPRLGAPGPRMDLVHYNLAVLHQQAGESDDAERHYRAVLRLDPDHFLASMNLGRLAAERRDWPAARGWFERAVELAPGSDDAHTNLGALYLVLGRPGPARRHLERALEINPRHAGARSNLELLERSGPPPPGAGDAAAPRRDPGARPPGFPSGGAI